MKKFSEKIYLNMEMPTEDDSRSDHLRLVRVLAAAGYENVRLSLDKLRQLHRILVDSGYGITVTLVCDGNGWVIASLEGGDTRSAHYGLAVDYGSTTIVMELVDMGSGAVISRKTAANGQRRFGTDILSRITFIMEDGANADVLRMATVETFNHLLEEITEESGIEAKKLPVMILSGNTVMTHFLLGLDGWTVFASPFAPVTTMPDLLRGQELDFDFEGLIYIMPAASNYVGGDIVSGLLNLDFYKKDGLGVFFDIGTNGELVMGNRHWLLAGAGAAGPALEGYISRFGVRAQSGAVDSVKIDGEKISVTTIGNEPAIGICGSGIIDLIAEMRLNGWINIAGELQEGASENIIHIEEENQLAAVYARDKNGNALYFSQTDIRQYLETKAAAHTMVDCLLESAGLVENDIDMFYLTGAFSAHSNLESAIVVGIFPDLPRDRFGLIQNASLEGARALLLNRDRLEDVKYIVENMYCVQFASIPDFTVRMHASKFIPHTDMEKYPSVIEKLREKGVSK